MYTILFFCVLTIIFIFINHKISESSLNFLKTLSILDGFIYFFYMGFCLGCLLLIFQDISLPLVFEHPIWFKILLIFTSFKLFSLKTNIKCILNPNNKTRLEVLDNLRKQDEILKEIEKNEQRIQEIKNKQKKILQEFKEELYQIDEEDCSEEEREVKIKFIIDKYDKLFRESKIDNNNDDSNKKGEAQ